MERLTRLLWVLTAAGSLFTALPAEARQPGESYVYLTIAEPLSGGPQRVSGRFEIALYDLNRVVALDADGDRAVSPQEFSARADAVFSYLEPRLTFFDDGEAHPAVIKSYELPETGFAAFGLIHFDIPSLQAAPGTLSAEYRFLYDGLDPTHRALLIIEENQRAGIFGNATQHSVSFGPGAERQRFSLSGPPYSSTFARFLSAGAQRPFSPLGYELLLILAALLTPLMIVRAVEGWAPAPSLSAATAEAVGLATLLALSQTTAMSLAAAGLISAPLEATRTAVAIGVSLIALNTLTQLIGGPSSLGVWAATLVIGLAHGAGLDVMQMGAQGPMLAPALTGFGAGLWVSEAVLAAVAAPILFLLSRLSLYRPLFVQLGAAALILAAGAWWAGMRVGPLGPPEVDQVARAFGG